jgi:hypothetical protein
MYRPPQWNFFQATAMSRARPGQNTTSALEQRKRESLQTDADSGDGSMTSMGFFSRM